MLFLVFLMAALLVAGPGQGTWVWRDHWRTGDGHSRRGGGEFWNGTLVTFRNRLGRGASGARKSVASDLEAMAVLVHHLGALLSGGRSPAQAWRELLDLQRTDPGLPSGSGPGGSRLADPGPLVAAAQAAALGESPALAIHRHVTTGQFAKVSGSSARQWSRLAACVRASELSGCPLAELLARFAIDLEHSADAERSRQTALAGPRASVALLGWLPFFGLGLGLLLGVDPVTMMLQSPLGGLSVGAGLVFWFLGRVWSSHLVRQAEAAP